MKRPIMHRRFFACWHVVNAMAGLMVGSLAGGQAMGQADQPVDSKSTREIVVELPGRYGNHFEWSFIRLHDPT